MLELHATCLMLCTSLLLGPYLAGLRGSLVHAEPGVPAVPRAVAAAAAHSTAHVSPDTITRYSNSDLI